jgi:HNH endonuclease
VTRGEALRLARAARAALAPLEERFWSKVDRRGPDECWPWKAAVRRPDEGYGAFWFEGRHRPSHVMALILSGTPVVLGMEACHRCDNPPCCNPGHLFLGTRQDNDTDRVKKGRQAFGAKVGTAKLSDEDAAVIKSLKPNGRAPNGLRQALAERFGVSRATIGDVWSRRWTHLS